MRDVFPFLAKYTTDVNDHVYFYSAFGNGVDGFEEFDVGCAVAVREGDDGTYLDLDDCYVNRHESRRRRDTYI